MTTIAGSTALITGGASGIGYLTGKRLLREGAAHLVIWDVNDDALRQAVAELTRRDRRVTVFRVDVTDLEQAQQALQQMNAAGIEVDLLINNAGVVVGKQFAEHSHEEIARSMAVNAMAPMHLAREVLPAMLERGAGHIVNVSSAAALVSNPGMSVYCASKWALAGWSDSLRLELERSRAGVRVTTVLPYYTDTGLFEGVHSPFIPLLKPESVARAIVSAIRSDRILVYVPWWIRVTSLLRGLLPARWFDTVGGDWVGVYRSMTTFKGRQP